MFAQLPVLTPKEAATGTLSDSQIYDLAALVEGPALDEYARPGSSSRSRRARPDLLTRPSRCVLQGSKRLAGTGRAKQPEDGGHYSLLHRRVENEGHATAFSAAISIARGGLGDELSLAGGQRVTPTVVIHRGVRLIPGPHQAIVLLHCLAALIIGDPAHPLADDYDGPLVQADFNRMGHLHFSP